MTRCSHVFWTRPWARHGVASRALISRALVARTLVGCLLVAGALTGCGASAAPSPTSAGASLTEADLAARVHALLDAWTAFWNDYDLNHLPELFASDAQVTYFSSEYAGLIRGPADLAAHHARFGFAPGGKAASEDPASARANRLWLTDVHWAARAGAVVVAAKWHFATPRSEKPQTGPVTFVLAPSPEELRILHSHFANDPVPKPAADE